MVILFKKKKRKKKKERKEKKGRNKNFIVTALFDVFKFSMSFFSV